MLNVEFFIFSVSMAVTCDEALSTFNIQHSTFNIQMRLIQHSTLKIQNSKRRQCYNATEYQYRAMEQPMQNPPPTLRPMGIADILDAMFRIYRNNFLTFIGIAALAQIPLMLVQLMLDLTLGRAFSADFFSLLTELTTTSASTWEDLPLSSIVSYVGVTLLLVLLQLVVIQQLMNGALTNAIARSYFGESTTIFGAYQLGSWRIGSLITAGLLVGLSGFVIFVVFFGLYFGTLFALSGSVGDRSGALGALASLLCVFGLFILVGLLVLYVVVRLLFITQAIVVEGKNAVEGIRRSWGLVQGSFWRTLGGYLLLSLLLQIVLTIPVGSATFAIQLTLGDPFDPLANYTLQQILTSLVTYGAQILVLPLQLTAFTLMYYDLRVRKEGYDLELRTGVVSEGAL
jgi:hypothetical protein